MRLINKFVWAVFIMLLSLTASAQEGNPVDELTGLLNSFKSLSADFAQLIYDANGNVIERDYGKMALQKPQKFRWQVLRPEKQLYVADGTYLWVYDVDLNQATKQKLSEAQTNSPAYLLSGNVVSLESRFDVSYAKKEGPGRWYKLVPKVQEDTFKSIELRFIDGKLAEMHIYSNLGQYTVFQFSNTQMNPPLAASLFRFVPPKGVDVVATE